MNILDRLIRKCELLKYNIAFIKESREDIVNGKKFHYQLLKHNKTNWFADPFILDVTEKQIILLVEEYDYKRWLGHISKLIIDKQTFELIEVKPILVLPTHLSYPAIIRQDKNIIVYPENGASYTLNSYIYDCNNDRLTKNQEILNIPVADATITDFFGESYLFCTKQKVCSGSTLTIFKKDNYGKWTEYQEYDFGEKIARMAGDFFKIGNSIYRPCQDCNECYGHGTVIQKVSLVEGKFQFEEIVRYFPIDRRYNHGIHTLNEYKGITVVDMEGWRWPILAKFAKLLRKIR